MRFPLLIGGLAFWAFTACSPSSVPPLPAARPAAPFLSNVPPGEMALLSAPHAFDGHQRRRWLEKTVRLLRGGIGLLPGENADDLLALPPEELLQRLTHDPRFGDFTLDFNQYFLGFKTSRLRFNGKYYDAYSFPSAVESAREVLRGGDYFRLFDLEAPTYFAPAEANAHNKSEEGLPSLELQRRHAALFQAGLFDIIRYARHDSTATVATVCNRFMVNHFQGGSGLLSADLPIELLISQLSTDRGWYLRAIGPCQLHLPTTLAELTASLEGIYEINARLFPRLETLFDPTYNPQSVADFRTIDYRAIGFTRPSSFWSGMLSGNLPNSSTNMERKRGAYALKRFFCDDLTPVGAEDPKEHTGGAHGSDPACAACHYKLDPMAGYFRNYGANFMNFLGLPIIFFDDLAIKPYAEYQQAWVAPAGSGRDWDVGYVRSRTETSRNDYGSDLPDLHALLRRAPEVKACLVKRLFEYSVGEEQTMDPGYLAGITEEFTQRAAKNSSEAFRWLAGQVVLSHTFSQEDPAYEQCYDTPPGVDPAHAPPCRVAYLLTQNCKGCHASVYDSGNLDLTAWQPGPDGRLTFPHLGAKGEALPLGTTLEQMVNALSTNDPKKRMPFGGRYMSPVDRESLFRWAQETLSKTKGGQP